jgi:hypothetical protein
MSSISIQELKNEATKEDVSVSELLRKIRIIAREKKEEEFLEWVKKESEGYKEDDEIPEYRIIKGDVRGFNPYKGWMSFTGGDLPDELYKLSLHESIIELEKLAKSGGDTNENLIRYFPPKIEEKLSEDVGLKTKFGLHVRPEALSGVINIIKNKIIDWLIDIDFNTTIEKEGKREEIFPSELIEKLDKGLKILADDFNFNYSNGRPVAGVLILRRLLPFSIVRKFQQLNLEEEIKDSNGDYLGTKALLGKIENKISNKRVSRELKGCKFLLDASQHSYAINIDEIDAKNVAFVVRSFLDDIFYDNESEK